MSARLLLVCKYCGKNDFSRSPLGLQQHVQRVSRCYQLSLKDASVLREALPANTDQAGEAHLTNQLQNLDISVSNTEQDAIVPGVSQQDPLDVQLHGSMSNCANLLASSIKI